MINLLAWRASRHRLKLYGVAFLVMVGMLLAAAGLQAYAYSRLGAGVALAQHSYQLALEGELTRRLAAVVDHKPAAARGWQWEPQLMALAAALPGDIWLTTLNAEGRRLNLTGQSRTLASIARLETWLQGQGALSQKGIRQSASSGWSFGYVLSGTSP